MAEDVSILDFIPLFPEETEETIRARWMAWANEGLSPEDVDEWVDVREGSFWWILTAPGIREAARIYDLMGTEFVAAAFPAWAWGDYLDGHAETLRLERLPATPAGGEVTFTGVDGTVIGAGTVLLAESSDLDAEPREYEVLEGGTISGGSVTLPIQATTPGSAGNAPAGAVNVPASGLPNVTGITNEAPIVGGTDPETDENLRERLLAAYDGRGPGTVRDYEVWARAYGGVGRATVVPLWDGPGTVQVIVATADGFPVSNEIVEGLQALLDPVAGQGAGEAPIGPAVTVQTVEDYGVGVTIQVEPETGYSLDGANGTVNLTAQIEAAVEAYIYSVEPGGEIVVAQLAARVVSIPGVHDLGAITLNGGAGNLHLGTNPPQRANLVSISLTEVDV